MDGNLQRGPWGPYESLEAKPEIWMLSIQLFQPFMGTCCINVPPKPLETQSLGLGLGKKSYLHHWNKLHKFVILFHFTRRRGE